MVYCIFITELTSSSKITAIWEDLLTHPTHSPSQFQ